MHLFNMSRADFLDSTPGEIYDLVACYGVFNGTLKEIPKKKPMSYDEALLALRV